MVTKLSSSRIISEASFATSVPVIPMAQPISAAFRAGASFTPSPVMATTSPFSLYAFTILNLCAGLTLANTLYRPIFFFRSSSDMASSITPVTISSPCFDILRSLAIFPAVSTWSPVIITVFIPALLHRATAFFTSFLGGSIREAIPAKTSPVSSGSLVWYTYL